MRVHNVADLVHEREVLRVGRHPLHDPVLDVEEDLLLLPVVLDEAVQRVRVRHPRQQPRVGRQRDHREPLDGLQRQQGRRSKSFIFTTLFQVFLL